ncbi:MAG: hypothetical protein M3137_05010 [Actinomycetota bacterium]|nr:hypothetical protein [Actinomycetota bacterium]
METGFLAGLMAKLAGLGSVAKVAIGTATAALTMTVAGGAAGVLPVPFDGGHAGPTVTVTRTEPAGTAGATSSATTDGSGVHTGAEASVATPAAPSSGSAGSAEVPGVSVPPVSIPPVSVPGAGLPDLSQFAQVPTQVLACLNPIVDLVKGLPGTPMGQLTGIGAQFAAVGPQIVSCVGGIVANLPLPSGMSACASSILGFVRNIVSQLPTSTPNVGGFDVAACIPTGLPVPTGLAGMPFMGGGFPFGH